MKTGGGRFRRRKRRQHREEQHREELKDYKDCGREENIGSYSGAKEENTTKREGGGFKGRQT